jgi:hypothetical protein
MNLESKILNNDVEKPKSYLLSNPERFFPTFFFSSFSTLCNYIMLSMCEGTISYKRGARKLKKNSSIRYCKNQTQTRQSTATKIVMQESKL